MKLQELKEAVWDVDEFVKHRPAVFDLIVLAEALHDALVLCEIQTGADSDEEMEAKRALALYDKFNDDES